MEVIPIKLCCLHEQAHVIIVILEPKEATSPGWLDAMLHLHIRQFFPYKYINGRRLI